MTVAPGAITVPDSTGPTISLLRELRRGRGKKQAANAAYWAYLIAIIVLAYGGSLIAAAARALRHPPPPSAVTPHVLQAAPAGLAALALVLLVVLLRDALWRGPVTLPQATVDWLMGTPVSRGRLLRPKFRVAAAVTVLAGAAVGIVPAAVLVGLGLGGRDTGSVMQLTGASMLSTALLFAVGTGAAGLVERYQAGRRWLRVVTPAALLVVAAFCGLAAWAATGRPPQALTAVALWSGPWGWAAQGMTASAGATGSLGRIAPGPRAVMAWPLAIGLLAVLAVAALATAQRAAAKVPGAALRVRARTIGAMSAAAANMDSRSVSTAFSDATRSRRARFRLPPPRRRELVLLWRDLLALARAPSRLAGAAVLALVGVGLLALAGHGRQVSLIPVACGLAVGYLAAAWLCEGARLDADDSRRSASLPFSFRSLAWRHAAVPCLVLLAVAGIPVIAATAVTADPRFLLLLVVTVPVLVGGAMVNVFRGQFPLGVFSGVDTGFGNTAAIGIVFWYVWGPVLAIAPMTALLASSIRSPGDGPVERAVVVGALLAAGLGAYAAHRAARRRAT